VEIKAVSALCDEHRSQVLNYLNATGCELGFLVNFGHHPQIEIERLILTKDCPRNTRKGTEGEEE
jgi:GxxExxY protein